MIDLTLDRLKRPAITGLVPSFGTTVEVTEKNKGGLSTTEVDANMALAYELQREVNVSTSDTTSIVEHDAKVALIGDEAITLTLQGASYGGCELKITNRGSKTATILYNEGASIQIPPRGYLRFIWTLQDWWVEQRRNPQEDGGNIQTYTYVVDSDQALIDWANNDRNKGQDYTSVLIKRGTWTSTIGVNLTNAGTKVIKGEAGSKLFFNIVDKGLFYSTAQSGSEYSISNITVEVYSNASFFGGVAFYGCTNLTKCTGITKTSKIVQGASVAFGLCTNLTNCTGETSGTVSNYAFMNCTNLTNCTGTASEAQAIESAGFSVCTNLTNCTGTGVGSNGVAFSNCKGVTKCKAGGNCTTNVFFSSYASQASTADYACADTPAGGFNDTTNPSA